MRAYMQRGQPSTVRLGAIRTLRTGYARNPGMSSPSPESDTRAPIAQHSVNPRLIEAAEMSETAGQLPLRPRATPALLRIQLPHVSPAAILCVPKTSSGLVTSTNALSCWNLWDCHVRSWGLLWRGVTHGWRHS
jgi:hypothetical protein